MEEVGTLVRKVPGSTYVRCNTCGCSFPIKVTQEVNDFDVVEEYGGINPMKLQSSCKESRPECEPKRCPGCNRLIYKVLY
jgi:transcription elongation factor Elf1